MRSVVGWHESGRPVNLGEGQDGRASCLVDRRKRQESSTVIPGMIVKLITVISTFMLLLQTTPVPGDPASLLGSAERLTLVGALVVAVVILWRTNRQQAE